VKGIRGALRELAAAAAGRRRAVGEEARTSNAGGAWAHLTESTGLGGAPWLRSGRGEEWSVWESKVWLRRAA
jgi:hypothetical protein